MVGSPLRIMIVIGTRPEAIKMAPVVHELARHAPRLSTFVCTTGQHRELLAPTLGTLELRPDRNLDIMTDDQSLSRLTARLFELLDPVVVEQQPDWMLIQGDTTTAMVAAAVAFYRRVRIGHVEAGLRTSDLGRPFPEELNRRVADLCSDLCFAPTPWARNNLLREGVPAFRVHVTGNTVVDAVLAMAARPYDERVGPLAALPRTRRWVLVTAHRRESFGAPLARIRQAIECLARTFADSIHVIMPVHPNPNVAATVAGMADMPNCSVMPPLDYPDLVHVMRRAALILTDSGGIQEEAPTFGVPVLVLREKTERPEAIDAGVARLVGTDPDAIVAEASRILSEGRPGAPVANPFGDGAASRRIVEILCRTASDTANPYVPPGTAEGIGST